MVRTKQTVTEEIQLRPKSAYKTRMLKAGICKRLKDKNDDVYYKVKFMGNRTIFHLLPNTFYEKTLKEFNLIYNIKEENLTEEHKVFKVKFKTSASIPKYRLYKLVNDKSSFYKVSDIYLREDVNGEPFYWIQKTYQHPWKQRDARHKLTRDYYIFHTGINKNLTIKNNAKLFYIGKPFYY